MSTGALPELSSKIQCKGFKQSWLCDGAIMLVEGPCGVTVLCYSSYTKGTRNSISILDRTVVDILAENAGKSKRQYNVSIAQTVLLGDDILVVEEEFRRVSVETASRRPMSILSSASMDEAPHIENFRLHVTMYFPVLIRESKQ